MAKKYQKEMTDNQFIEAIKELNMKRHTPKLRGGRTTQAHKNLRRYDRRQGKRIDTSMY